MSDDITGLPEQPSRDPVRDAARLDQRRASLAKGRAIKMEKMKAEREAQARTAPARTAADVRPVQPMPAARAEPAREITSGPEQLTRRRRSDRSVGGFDFPEHIKKPGWDYQGVAIRVLNQEVDRSEIRDYHDGGWRPCKAGDYPSMVDPDMPADSPIEMRGIRFYERPMSFTMEARQEDLKFAQEQQRDRTLAAASGRSAIRGEEGIPNRGGTRAVPGSVEIEGLIG